MDYSPLAQERSASHPPSQTESESPRPDTAASPKPEATINQPYPPPASQPTQFGPQGIRFDFNHGARVVLPNRTEGKWRVRLCDLDTGNILFQTENQGAFVSSAKRFFVRFSVEVWELDAAGMASPVLSHEYDARDREILIQFPVGTLGDILAWFSYAARFGQVHGCRLTCAMSGLIIPLLRDAYPAIRFVTHEELVEQDLPSLAYATYCLGLFFDDKDFIHQPTDFRHVGLHRTAGYILGVDPAEEPPRLVLPDESRPIPDPYVCIGVQSSTQSKNWTNPYGWREVVAFLKARGYRVICIDKNPVHGTGIVWNHIPNGAEDETGDRPLVERARWLRHAAAFVGLSSGLSWLAWAAGTPVVLISGFTHPNNEFTTPYRVINWHACNSCWNDVRLRFDHKDFLWCPRHAGTPRQFECTRLITATQVIGTLERLFQVAGQPANGPSPAMRLPGAPGTVAPSSGGGPSDDRAENRVATPSTATAGSAAAAGPLRRSAKRQDAGPEGDAARPVHLDGPAASISFVTGVDHRMFDQLHLLMGSLHRNSPSLRLHVCDFGLSDSQRQFLRRKDMLLERPDGLGPFPHPWYYKAALGRYVAGLATEAVVWLDADLIVLSDIRTLLEDLHAGMRSSGEVIAAAAVGTIGAQLAMDPAPHYASLVARFSPDRPYLIAGFFLCRSADFLRDWSAQCAAMPMEMLFEQNAFNLTALAQADRVRVLDPSVWNLAAHELREMPVEASDRGIAVTSPVGPVHILHATSLDRARDLVSLTMPITVDGCAFAPSVRMIRAPERLMAWQKALVVETITREAQLLAASGLGTPMLAAECLADPGELRS